MKKFWLATVDAFSTFLKVPGTVTRRGAHVRDAIDLKRIMIIAVISVVPAAIFGMWNVGYQHALAIGDGRLQILANFWYGFLKVLPLYVVAYGVGLIIEFFSAGIRNPPSTKSRISSSVNISGRPFDTALRTAAPLFPSNARNEPVTVFHSSTFSDSAAYGATGQCRIL